MKKIFKLVAPFCFILAVNEGFSQQNPAVSNLTVAPAPAQIGEPATFTANIGNYGTQPITGAGAANRMGFTMGLSSGVSLADISEVTGTVLDYFDLTYDPATRVITARQKAGVAIPAITATTISVPVMVNAEPVSSIINIQPNATAAQQNQPPGDDEASIETALPVNLVEFSVAREGNIASLQWATASETKSDYFDVQTGTDGKSWAFAGRVRSNGESISLKRYSFVHTKPSSGVNYYRLKMVDIDGSFAFSPIQSVTFADAAGISVVVYPNPVSERLFLQAADLSLVKALELYSYSGQLLRSTVDTQKGLQVKGLSSGLYLLKVLNKDGSTSSQKVMIQ
jgi:hypothetical protein